MDAVVEILRDTARDVVGADGIAVVLRDGPNCYYVAEDAEAPLWAGSRFPMESCVSGWAMMHRETVSIPDIRLDPRIPQAAYEPTFVRSLVMAPIGAPQPVAALGAYWADVREQGADVIARLEALARTAAIALENARLIASIQASERRARESEERFRALVNATSDVVYRMSADWRELRRLDGRGFLADTVSPSIAWIDAYLPPEDQPAIMAAVEDAIRCRGPFQLEHRVRQADGSIGWTFSRAVPLFDEAGEIVEWFGAASDITERRNAEAALEARVVERTARLIETQEALRHSQKLEAMGQLTGGVAHDFNNLLTPIIGSLDLLQRRHMFDLREQRLIDGAMQSADRARVLVQRLLAFARRQPLQATSVRMDELLEGMTELLATTAGSGVRISVSAAPGLPAARADGNQLELAILNLCVNARDAMPGGGELRIAATAEMIDAGHVSGLAPGRYVLLSIADTGVGMAEETLARAIEPFFSTKGIGKGTGLGLSMVHGLASQLEGGLRISSRLGEGTVVRLWLPVADEETAAPGIDVAVEPPGTGLGTALIVDDEELVRASTAEMLRDIGYEVIEAATGREALDLVESGMPLEVLITDHLMPGMTGVELARSVRARFPLLPILIVSGFAEEIGLDADLPRLTKPFRQAELAARLIAAGATAA